MTDLMPTLFTAGMRDDIVREARHNPRGGAFRKTARIVGFPAVGDFVIETDRGPMTGHPGDWIVTNHPDDDPGSDIWSISAERMASTYTRLLRMERTDEYPASPGPDKQPGAFVAELPE